MDEFYIASLDEIKRGETTDIYFRRTEEILKKKNIHKKVVAEFSTHSFPNNWPWAIFSDIKRVLSLLEGKNIDLYALDEGTIFTSHDIDGNRIPTITIEGDYTEFCVYETPILGLICFSNAVTTRAARVKKAAGDSKVLAFGTRRMEPSLAPILDVCAYIGGCDGVSSIIGAEAICKKPQGTMPHGLILAFQDQKKAFLAYDDVLDKSISRVALIDTLKDETDEAKIAIDALGDKLDGVRLDTAGSREGGFEELIPQIRKILDDLGYKDVKIFVSGGLKEYDLPKLVEVGADGFGIGTAISSAPTIDYAMDIVEVEGKPFAKRTKNPGRKYVFRCPKCLTYKVRTKNESIKCPKCEINMRSMYKKYIEGGKIIKNPKGIEEIRKKVQNELKKVDLEF